MAAHFGNFSPGAQRPRSRRRALAGPGRRRRHGSGGWARCVGVDGELWVRSAFSSRARGAHAPSRSCLTLAMRGRTRTPPSVRPRGSRGHPGGVEPSATPCGPCLLQHPVSAVLCPRSCSREFSHADADVHASDALNSPRTGAAAARPSRGDVPGCSALSPGVAARAGRRFAKTVMYAARNVDFDMVDSGSAGPW